MGCFSNLVIKVCHETDCNWIYFKSGRELQYIEKIIIYNGCHTLVNRLGSAGVGCYFRVPLYQMKLIDLLVTLTCNVMKRDLPTLSLII